MRIDNNKVKALINIWIIVFSSLFVVFAIYFLINSKTKSKEEVVESQVSAEEKVTFKLKGKKKLVINVDDDYVEEGYYADSNIAGDVSSYVKIDGDVDTSVVGTYKIAYTLNYKGIEPTLFRTVVVSKKTASDEKEEVNSNSSTTDISPSLGSDSSDGKVEATDPDSVVTIYLSGSPVVYVLKGANYQDLGASAVNKSGEDITKNIKTMGSVDTSKVGEYVLTYTISDSKNRSVSVSRKVNVVDISATIKPSVTTITKDDINLTISVTSDIFSYMVLPNGEKVNSATYTYPVTSNGNYSFEVYNAVGLGKRYTYAVKNIDKEKPTGSCSVRHDDSGSVIDIVALDNMGIKSYVYKDKKYNVSSITLGEYLKEDSTVEVGFYDKANNYGTASCVVPVVPDEYLVDDDNKVTITKPVKVDIKYIDATDLGCTITAGGYVNVAKKIAFNSAIADQTHNIFKNVCTYVNKTPWIATLQHDGAYVNRTITEHDYHSQGLAIDLNDLWTYTGSDGTVYNPYGGQGTWTWTKYKKFICEVCDGQEDCQYNINYIIFKRYFEGNGWCWGGNWSPAYFDPMHFEVRAGGCSSANKQRITCE